MVRIKTVLTALENPGIQEKLKTEEIEIKSFDIQYREGILEYLEEDSNIDFIIISECLPGNIELQELIQGIKKINNQIKIILISKKEEASKIKGILKKFDNLDFDTIEKIKSEITGKRMPRKTMNLNLDETKKIKTKENKLKTTNAKTSKSRQKTTKVKDNKSKQTDENDKWVKSKANSQRENIFKKVTISKSEIIETKEREGEIISIAGTSGIGKSTFSILFAQNSKKSKKVIIDFDFINNSLHTILGINLYPEKLKKKIKQKQQIGLNNINIKDFIVSTKYGVDVISGLNLIFEDNNQTNPLKIVNLITKIKKYYDLIIIDTASYGLFDYTKEIFKISNKILFISGANELEVKKSKNLLRIYEEQWGIDPIKTEIIFNKYSEKSIDDQVLINLFKEYKVLGKVKLRDYYDFMINNKTSVMNQINEELEKIQMNLDKNDALIKKLKLSPLKTAEKI